MIDIYAYISIGGVWQLYLDFVCGVSAMISGNFQSLVSTMLIYQRCFALKSLLAGVNSVLLRIKMSFFPCQMYSFSVFHLINAFTQAKKYTPFIRDTIKSPGIKSFQKYFSPPRAGPTLQGGIFVFFPYSDNGSSSPQHPNIVWHFWFWVSV